MPEAGSSNRWWESYLVRYFMPSIAGVAIVCWLTSACTNGPKLKEILFFGLLAKGSERASARTVNPLRQFVLLRGVISDTGIPCDSRHRFQRNSLATPRFRWLPSFPCRCPPLGNSRCPLPAERWSGHCFHSGNSFLGFSTSPRPKSFKAANY